MSRTDTSGLGASCRVISAEDPAGTHLDDLPLDELLAIYERAEGLGPAGLARLVRQLGAEGVAGAEILLAVPV